MRSFVLVIICCFVLAVGFIVYYWRQPPLKLQTQADADGTTAPLPIKPNDGAQRVGHTENIWVKHYNEKTGVLASEFRAAEYNPQPDGRVAVVAPEARFFLSDQRSLRIRGKTGIVTVEPSDKPRDVLGQSAASQSPSRGELHDVTLDLLDAAGDADPVLTLTVNNASFDNDEFRINTDAYTDPATGQHVEADQVPVVECGRDYDFDGRGLLIKWNERDHRLEYLEVSHGQRLVLKHPASSSPAHSSAALSGAAPPAQPAAPSVQPAAAPVVAAPVVRPAAPPEKPPLYRASFLDSVRVVQADQELVTAQTMTVDFLMGSDTAAPTRTPAPQPSPVAPGPSASTGVSPSPGSPGEGRGEGPPPQSSAPVTVFWTGKLTLVPLVATDPIPAGQEVIEFQGAPVTARQHGSEVKCATLAYHTADGAVFLARSAGVPLVLTRTDEHGTSVVDADRLTYSRAQHSAVLQGAGSAELPVVSAGAPRGQAMHAEWSKSCTLYFAGSGDEAEPSIERAVLDGDVRVRHPQLQLNAQSLELSFNTPSQRPTTQPSGSALRQIEAAGAVHCDLSDARKTQTIDCDRLSLLMGPGPEGKLVPRTVEADGDVHTRDPDQDLRAGHLSVALAPATRPIRAATAPSADSDVRLESLHASQDVRVIMKDGAIASADTLLINTVAGRPDVQLLGQPFATISGRRGVITGAVIEIFPDGQQLAVDGPGTMHGVQQDAGDSAPRPMDIAWTRSVRYDGKTDVIDCLGSVTAKSVDHDGATVNTAAGDRMKIMLAPTTAPSTRAAGANPFADKTIRQIVLTDNAEAGSIQLNADHSVLHSMELYAQTIEYDWTSVGSKAVRRLVVPGAGKMLIEDHHPPATRPAPSGAFPANAQGATALKWSRSMTYDDASQKLVIDGDVLVDHREAGPDTREFRMAADAMTAELVQAPAPATRGASTRPGGERIELKHAAAVGHVIITNKAGELRCDVVNYDPPAHLLTATSNAGSRALFTPATPTVRPMEAQEFQWDLAQALPSAVAVTAEIGR